MKVTWYQATEGGRNRAVADRPEFCCPRMKFNWGEPIVFAHNQIDTGHPSITAFGTGLAIYTHFEDSGAEGIEEESYLFIDYCPFCGEKIEIIEEN